MGRDSYRKNDMIFGKWRDLQLMRTSTKWHPIPKLQTSKRMKTSLSGKYTITQSDYTGRCFVNLNESDEEVEMDMPPPSPQRLPGQTIKEKATSFVFNRLQRHVGDCLRVITKNC
ncbi:hypothetical protein R6Q57_028736 [Mikania cordata]